MKTQKKRDASPKKPWKTIFIVNAIGIDFVVCVVGGFYLGTYLQKLAGHILWMVAGLLLGVGVGIWSVILILMRYMGGSDE